MKSKLRERRLQAQVAIKFRLPTRIFVKEENNAYNTYLDDVIQKSFVKKDITKHYDAHLEAHFLAAELAEKHNCMFKDEADWW